MSKLKISQNIYIAIMHLSSQLHKSIFRFSIAALVLILLCYCWDCYVCPQGVGNFDTLNTGQA
ncbi:hypothetical protein K450DRAFT_246638 [Umbelopsis ramanniana AG]|uniref:Uncharacterized protein n=1 Tax=Umbelopsis ramanniana AG TaxID=1314678 RepID=A0AAD5E933_UMBRA|nr:uncharacterized protein K450DRAFT_246638 [Umbelopsis ramanniana AG]KAI8578600.1 hypothetical protein K450DRAFT_246638 [Umbelopsis ramanniana AG]